MEFRFEPDTEHQLGESFGLRTLQWPQPSPELFRTSLIQANQQEDSDCHNEREQPGTNNIKLF